MKFVNERIEKLILDGKWSDIVQVLAPLVQSQVVGFNDYCVFINAVLRTKDLKNYSLAFFCFVQAVNSKDKNSAMLNQLFHTIEPIIKSLGFRYFDDYCRPWM